MFSYRKISIVKSLTSLFYYLVVTLDFININFLSIMWELKIISGLLAGPTLESLCHIQSKIYFTVSSQASVGAKKIKFLRGEYIS